MTSTMAIGLAVILLAVSYLTLVFKVNKIESSIMIHERMFDQVTLGFKTTAQLLEGHELDIEELKGGADENAGSRNHQNEAR